MRQVQSEIVVCIDSHTLLQHATGRLSERLLEGPMQNRLKLRIACWWLFCGLSLNRFQVKPCKSSFASSEIPLSPLPCHSPEVRPFDGNPANRTEPGAKAGVGIGSITTWKELGRLVGQRRAKNRGLCYQQPAGRGEIRPG